MRTETSKSRKVKTSKPIRGRGVKTSGATSRDPSEPRPSGSGLRMRRDDAGNRGLSGTCSHREHRERREESLSESAGTRLREARLLLCEAVRCGARDGGRRKVGAICGSILGPAASRIFARHDSVRNADPGGTRKGTRGSSDSRYRPPGHTVSTGAREPAEDLSALGHFAEDEPCGNSGAL